MILEFSVENFLTYNEKATINFCQNGNITKHALLLGANASGKSTLKHALKECIKYMNTQDEISESENVCFKYSAGCVDKPSKFEIVFKSSEGIFFRYSLDILYSKAMIQNELLEYKQNIDDEYSIVFVRDLNNKFTIGENVKNGQWELQKVVNAGISVEQSKTLLAQLFAGFLNEERVYLKQLKSLVSNFNNATLRQLEFDHYRDTNKNSNIFNKFAQIADSSFEKFDQDTLDTNNMSIIHKGDVKISIHNEAFGTMRMLELAPFIVDTIKNGGFLCIDEFEFALHPMLVQSIVEMFNNTEFNINNAQILLIGHSGTLMRDIRLSNYDIWICQKDPNHSSQIYNLGEYYREFEDNIQLCEVKRFDKYITGQLFSSPAPKYILETIKTLIHKEDKNES